MRVKEIREKRGILAKDLAETIYVDVGLMSKIENGRCLPNTETMSRMQEALNATVDEMYDPEEIYYETRKAKKKKSKSDYYKVTVKLPKEAKAFLASGVLKRAGYASITDWIRCCLLRLRDQDSKRAGGENRVRDLS